FSSRRRHTRFSRDWSSDVCSPDLPLKRVIQRNLQDPLAELLLAGEVADGATVTVSAGAEGLIIDGHEVNADTGEVPSASGSAVKIGRASCRGGEEVAVATTSRRET